VGNHEAVIPGFQKNGARKNDLDVVGRDSRVKTVLLIEERRALKELIQGVTVDVAEA
jgi:hypothetical protein